MKNLGVWKTHGGENPFGDRIYPVSAVLSHTRPRQSILVFTCVIPMAVYNRLFAAVFVWEATSAPREDIGVF